MTQSVRSVSRLPKLAMHYWWGVDIITLDQVCTELSSITLENRKEAGRISFRGDKSMYIHKQCI